MLFSIFYIRAFAEAEEDDESGDEKDALKREKFESQCADYCSHYNTHRPRESENTQEPCIFLVNFLEEISLGHDFHQTCSNAREEEHKHPEEIDFIYKRHKEEGYSHDEKPGTHHFL